MRHGSRGRNRFDYEDLTDVYLECGSQNKVARQLNWFMQMKCINIAVRTIDRSIYWRSHLSQGEYMFDPSYVWSCIVTLYCSSQSRDLFSWFTEVCFISILLSLHFKLRCQWNAVHRLPDFSCCRQEEHKVQQISFTYDIKRLDSCSHSLY